MLMENKTKTGMTKRGTPCPCCVPINAGKAAKGGPWGLGFGGLDSIPEDGDDGDEDDETMYACDVCPTQGDDDGNETPEPSQVDANGKPLPQGWIFSSKGFDLDGNPIKDDDVDDVVELQGASEGGNKSLDIKDVLAEGDSKGVLDLTEPGKPVDIYGGGGLRG